MLSIFKPLKTGMFSRAYRDVFTACLKMDNIASYPSPNLYGACFKISKKLFPGLPFAKAE
jgi:hypothetical protein